MRHLLLWFAIGAVVIVVYFWNEGDRDCQPQDEWDSCEQDREDRQF